MTSAVDSLVIAAVDLMVLDLMHGNELAGTVCSDLLQRYASILTTTTTSVISSSVVCNASAQRMLRRALAVYNYILIVAGATELIAHSPEMRQGIVDLCKGIDDEGSTTAAMRDRTAQICCQLLNTAGVSRTAAAAVLRLLKELALLLIDAAYELDRPYFDAFDASMATTSSNHQPRGVLASPQISVHPTTTDSAAPEKPAASSSAPQTVAASTRSVTAVAAQSVVGGAAFVVDATLRDPSPSPQPDPNTMLPPSPPRFPLQSGRRISAVSESAVAQRRSAAATPHRGTPSELSPAMDTPLILPSEDVTRATVALPTQRRMPQPSAEGGETTRSTIRVAVATSATVTTGDSVRVPRRISVPRSPEDRLLATPVTTAASDTSTGVLPPTAQGHPVAVAPAAIPVTVRKYALCPTCGVYHDAQVLRFLGCSAVASVSMSHQ